MKVQELEQYKEQCRNNQEEVKALKAKVHIVKIIIILSSIVEWQ